MHNSLGFFSLVDSVAFLRRLSYISVCGSFREAPQKDTPKGASVKKPASQKWGAFLSLTTHPAHECYHVLCAGDDLYPSPPFPVKFILCIGKPLLARA